MRFDQPYLSEKVTCSIYNLFAGYERKLNKLLSQLRLLGLLLIKAVVSSIILIFTYIN